MCYSFPTVSKIDKISISLTRAQHAKIKAAVKRGDYASTSEVIRTALREWELKEELRRIEGERLAKLWDEGIASGPGRFRDIGEIIAEARARAAKSGDQRVASGASLEGPAIMERLRRKYRAMEKSSRGKRQRKPKR